MHGERLMALLFFPNWVHVINEPFSWQLVASPVRGALQRQPGVWPVLQGSCYTRGGAFLGAQTDISRAAVEDAEVRGVICMTFSWALEAPSSCSLLFPRCGEGILRAQKCEWGQGIWYFFCFLQFTCDGLFRMTSFPCETCWDTYSKHCVSESYYC